VVVRALYRKQNGISQPQSSRSNTGKTHLADDLVQEEKVELREHEEDEGEGEVQDRPDFAEDTEYDINHQQEIDDRRGGRPYAREDEQADVMERLGRVRAEDRGEAQGGVEGDVQRGGEDEDGEDADGNEGGRRAIFHDLGRYYAVGEENPEERGDESGVDSGEDDESSCSLGR
jgi:hypothetical protein